MHDSFKVKATILSQQWMAWTATHTHTHKAMGLKIHDIEQPTYIFHTWQISMQDPARKLSYLCLWDVSSFFIALLPKHGTADPSTALTSSTTTIQPLTPQLFSPWHHNHLAHDTTTIQPLTPQPFTQPTPQQFSPLTHSTHSFSKLKIVFFCHTSPIVHILFFKVKQWHKCLSPKISI